MVPRIHKRGSSFQGACRYILHDPGKDSSDRVLWKLTANVGDIALEDAWRAMFETWSRRTALKREAGVDLRGRDNRTPVLHLTLSWAQDETPTPEHMKATALSAMKALGLAEHQALITAHSDKEHLHVHLVVNTVHPKTGRTAPLKHSKLELSKWAEAYEKEHGIKIAKRIENNAARQQNKRVRDRSPPRNRYIQKKDVLLRLKRLRTELDHRSMTERNVLYARRNDERLDLVRQTKEAARVAIDYVAVRFKSRWRDIYEAQRQEARHVDSIRGNIFERAAYVFWNARRLGSHKPLSLTAKIRLIRSPGRLQDAVEALHLRERRWLSSVQKVETKERLDRVWAVHAHRSATLVERYQPEIERMKAAQKARRLDSATYLRAKNQLILERNGAAPRHAAGLDHRETDADYVARVRDVIDSHYDRIDAPKVRFIAGEPKAPAPDVARAFEQAASPQAGPQESPATLSRAEQIKRDMEEWRKRNEGKDFGREMDGP